ncbi:hypothetical protein DPMN_112566 [Dreissena polymorpha]|uniref:Uncharacterized protein n=1 Tax=Dreissena polymorpha TaxID=45954 RepID=A0A9D4KH17_DREPO|nr:hypothetical protein DPMN_112566 [Dreissena polymorpha]
MAPDGWKDRGIDGRTERRTDEQRQNKILPPMAGDNKQEGHDGPASLHCFFFAKKTVKFDPRGIFEQTWWRTIRCHYIPNLTNRPTDQQTGQYAHNTDRPTDRQGKNNMSPTTIFAHLSGTNILIKSVNARVFTNQMWTNGRRTKTNSKTSPEQSVERKTIFQLVREINKTNTHKAFDHKENCPPPPGGHFHDDWAKNVTSRVFTSFFYYINTIFELVRDINKTNVLSNFQDDWAKIVTSSVFTRNTAPPTGGHVFLRTRTTFELNQHIINTNILTNFELNQDFIGTKLLTKFHKDRTINVASSVNKQMWTDGQTTDKDRSQKLT